MLDDQHRAQLDGVVQQMTQNQESDANIQAVVNDFKSKYDLSEQLRQPQGFLDQLTAKSNPYGSYAGEAAKTAYNVLPSFLKTVKGAVTAPYNIAKTIARIPGEAKALVKEAGGIGNAARLTFEGLPEANYRAVSGIVPAAQTLIDPQTGVLPNYLYSQRPGVSPQQSQQFANQADISLQEIQRSVTEDPVGNILPLLLGTKAIAKKYGYGKQFNQAIETIASPVVKPARFLGKVAASTARGLAAREAGTTSETVSRIAEKPGEFSLGRIRANTRDDVINNVDRTIHQRLEDLSETGKGYTDLRNSGQVAQIPNNWLADSLRKNGWSSGQLSIDRAGGVRPGLKPTRLATISNAEQGALRTFMDTFGLKNKLTIDEYLDGRKFLQQWGKFQTQVAGTDQGKALFRQLYHDYGQVGDSKFAGLRALDARYAPEVRELSKIRSDYLNADGTLKDTASSKIANLTNKGREQVLGRLEKLMPGITEELKTMKAIEDINNASANKVGTYTKGAISTSAFGGTGFSVAGIPGAVVGGIIGMVLSHPSVATQLIRAYGYAKGVNNVVLNKIVKQFEGGIKLLPLLNVTKTPEK